MPRARTDRIEIPTGEDAGSDSPILEPPSEETEFTGAADAGAEGLGTGSGDSGTQSRHPLDDGDPRIIRDEFGNPTFSPTGRLRKRRTGASHSGAAETFAPKAKATKKVPVDALSKLLVMAHAMGANLTRTPELEINSGEAKMLADPLSELLVLYEVEPDPRIMAMMEFGLAASYVYGPRFTMIRMRLKAEATARQAAREQANQRAIQPDNGEAFFAPVINMNTGPATGFN